MKKIMAGYKGKYKVKNPQKYSGNSSNVVYRSLWERNCMRWFDETPNILKWSSEEIIIRYYNPVDNKNHRYFPDFYIEYIDKNGVHCKAIIEVKPKKQTVEPTLPKNMKSKRYITEMTTWITNSQKWDAAKAFCVKNGYKFIIMTEDNIPGLQKNKTPRKTR